MSTWTGAMPKVTERDVLDQLNFRYSKYNGNGVRYSRAEHVKLDIGHEARRILDYMCVDLWGGYTGPKIHGHEIKTSRSDWLTEIRDPEKAQAFAQYMDYFWLVVSDKDIVRPGELPAGWGLMISYGHTTRVLVDAPQNMDVLQMRRGMQATLSRAVMKTTVRLTMENDQATEYVKRQLRLGR